MAVQDGIGVGALPPAAFVVSPAVTEIKDRELSLRLVIIDSGDIHAHAPVGAQCRTAVADHVHLAACQAPLVDAVRSRDIHRIAIYLSAGLHGRISVVEDFEAVHFELVFILARGNRADRRFPDAVGALAHFLDKDLPFAEGQFHHPRLRSLETERNHPVRSDDRRERRFGGLPPPGGGESLRRQCQAGQKGDQERQFSHKAHS